MTAPKPSVTSSHIPDARLFRMAVAENLVFSGAEFLHLKGCSICFERWTEYIHEYVRDDDKQIARMKRGE